MPLLAEKQLKLFPTLNVKQCKNLILRPEEQDVSNMNNCTFARSIIAESFRRFQCYNNVWQVYLGLPSPGMRQDITNPNHRQTPPHD